jgi:MraZ protein
VVKSGNLWWIMSIIFLHLFYSKGLFGRVMAFFSSEYECKLDAKGRLVLPAKIKAQLPESGGTELMLRRGFEPCLVLYPLLEYKKIYNKIAGLNEFNEEFRMLQRNFFRGNALVDLDTMGRFLIPKPMIRYSQLEKQVIVVGMGNRVEIWNPDLYDKYLINDQSEFSKLAQKYLDQ